MIDDGSYFSNKEDPLTRLLGPEHGGRSRTVSNIIGRTQVREGLFQVSRQQHQDNMPTNQTRSYSGLDSSPNSCGENDTSGGCHIQYPLIEEPTLCELLHPSPSKREQIVGTAYLHPSPSRTIHTGPMAEGYVKIQVVEIYQLYKKTSLPELSRNDALKYIGDAIGWFIQWPLSLVKLSRSTEATSQNPALTQPAQDNSCYRPEVPIEQDQSHECYQIDATMIESFGDEVIIFYLVHMMFPLNMMLTDQKRNWMRWFLFGHRLKKATQVAYFNTQRITGKECEENLPSVKEHLVEVYKLHEGNKYFLAPFLYSRHWVLFIVSPSERKGWILDSTYLRGKKNKSHYSLTNAIETSFGGRFTWKMVKCKQQEGSWECGFLVVRNMFEFVISRQFGFPNNISFLFFTFFDLSVLFVLIRFTIVLFDLEKKQHHQISLCLTGYGIVMWNGTTDITGVEIDKLVENIMCRFFFFFFFFAAVFSDKNKK
ncbi:putative Ulp1 protease family catalytic domain, papain-like cysteine peptidase superfamily [Helianthus annuus]|nr:putative Ulp1 protease family catalytic domain, papain-like cysteine peptidase superfamily [Helianthus annuus]